MSITFSRRIRASSLVLYCTTAEIMRAFLSRAQSEKELRASTSPIDQMAGKVRMKVITRNRVGDETGKPFTNTG